MSEQQEIEYLLTVNAAPAYSEVAKLESIVIRNLGLVRRLTGNEDLSKAVGVMQRTIMTLRVLLATMHLVEIASGPIGWALALTSLGGLAVSSTDMMMSIGE